MGWRWRNLGLDLLCLLLLLLLAGGGGAAAEKEAYVTLLYGDEFVLGVRVLGKSIRDTGSNKDMLVLVSDGVSAYAENLLAADGWKVEHISLLANPNQKRPKRFWGVYTKLKIFNLTMYNKVVYLDADTIVTKNIDDLFQCGKFCANLKHSERMNSGVMVVEPSEAVFKDMMSKVNYLPSYTGGDQGFLNSYFSDFANSRVYEPKKSSEVSKLTPEPETQRLSTLYNADVGLYMLANKWMVDEKELRVIHYTLGPLKPWDWWTAWLVKPVDVWQNVRERLEESLPGTSGGRNPHDQLVVRVLCILPFCLLLFSCYRSHVKISKDVFNVRFLSSLPRQLLYKMRSGAVLPTYSTIAVASSSTTDLTHQQLSVPTNFKLPPYLGAASVLLCIACAAISISVSFVIIPRQVLPWTGLLLIYEWTFTLFFILFGSYLRIVQKWGSTSNLAAYSSLDSSSFYFGKDHDIKASDCDPVACFYWVGMAVIASFVPLLPSILGITALFVKLGMMVVGGIALASFMAFASEHLAIRAFVKGQMSRGMSRS